MKIKLFIAKIGFVSFLLGASADLEYSDLRVVAAMVFGGLFLLWFGTKGLDDYECCEDDWFSDAFKNK